MLVGEDNRLCELSRSRAYVIAPDAPAGSTIHVPSGRVAPLWDIAQARTGVRWLDARAAA